MRDWDGLVWQHQGLRKFAGRAASDATADADAEKHYMPFFAVGSDIKYPVIRFPEGLQHSFVFST